MVSFPSFSRLPAELRRQIWNEACPAPGAHVFEICTPISSQGVRIPQESHNGANSSPHAMRYRKLHSTPFFDKVMTMERKEHGPNNVLSRSNTFLSRDPSAYHTRWCLRSSCFEAFSVLHFPDPSVTNVVYLPLQDQRISYSNVQDLLVLSFRHQSGSPAQSSAQQSFADRYDDQSPPLIFASGLSGLLIYPWSTGFAATIQNARRIALDVADLLPSPDCGGDALGQEIACLGSCLQNQLEVLYVVDHPMNYMDRAEGKTTSRSCSTTGALAKRLQRGSTVDNRVPDIFHGTHMVYHEVSSLDSFCLDLEDENEIVEVLGMLADAIWEQQGQLGCFRGIRLLKCQESRL